MGIEIERKFLVDGTDWRDGTPTTMKQGYLAAGSVTVRVRSAGNRAWLTLKGPTTGISRAEFEYEIPADDATRLLQLCNHPPVVKTRYRVEYGGSTWEVDEFHDANAGLVIAEVELAREDEDPAMPPWLRQEVSHDPRYRNSYLAETPYTTWPEEGP